MRRVGGAGRGRVRLREAGGPVAPPSPLLQFSQLSRVGFLALPTGANGVTGFANAGWVSGIAFDPAGNSGAGSLFIAGRETDTNIGGPTLAEVTIPTPNAVLASAPTVGMLQNLVNPDDGAIDAGTPRDAGGVSWHAPIRAGGYHIDGSTLYGTWYMWYDGSNALTKFIYRRPRNLSTASHEGPLGPAGISGWIAGGMCSIPAVWQARLGNKRILSGLSGISVASRSSYGPPLVGWDPTVGWSPGGNGDLSYQALAYYPNNPGQKLASYEGVADQVLGTASTEPWTAPQVWWSGAMFTGHGLVFPVGCDTVLWFCTVGTTHWGYGDGTNAYYSGAGAGIFPPNPPCKSISGDPSQDDLTSGQRASTNGAGTRVTIPFMNSSDVTTDGTGLCWLKTRSTPVQNAGFVASQRTGVAAVTAKGNSSLANSYVDVDVAFTGNLTNQTYRVGRITFYDPAVQSSGNHAWPYHIACYAFNANDLAAVAAGTKNAYNVLPYALWDLDSLVNTQGWGGFPDDCMGVAYDPATKRIYVSQEGGGAGGTNIIVVLQHT